MALTYLTGTHRGAGKSSSTVGTGLGLLAQPLTYGPAQVADYPVWAADNGCFGKDFSVGRWYSWLQRMAPYAGNCLFATVPDRVGDPFVTQDRFDVAARLVRQLGFKVALVAQDDVELTWDLPHNATCRTGYYLNHRGNHRLPGDAGTATNYYRGQTTVGWKGNARAHYLGTCTCGDWWDDFDALFIGGGDQWKLSSATADLVRQAKDHGKWVHMGRVNTKGRLEYADAIGCDSVDGTCIAFGPDKNLPALLRWLGGLQEPLAAAAA